MKILMGGAAAFLLAAFTLVGSANAECWWDGFNWRCAGPTYAYPYYGNNWGSYAPNWYEAHPGYKPDWLPSLPGPRASSGSGR
jgi:hypothetical protein